MPTPASRPTIFYGWIIVAATFLIALVTAGGRNAFGVFVVPMSEEFGWNRSTISLVAALGLLINGLSQPLLGRLFDRFGGRRVILAGGLTASNVAEAIGVVQPFGVDVSSGVEDAPGIKNPDKLRALFEALRGVAQR